MTAPPPDSGLTADKLQRALLAWRKLTSPSYRGLLDAEPVGEKSESPPPVPRF